MPDVLQYEHGQLKTTTTTKGLAMDIDKLNKAHKRQGLTDGWLESCYLFAGTPSSRLGNPAGHNVAWYKGYIAGFYA